MNSISRTIKDNCRIGSLLLVSMLMFVASNSVSAQVQQAWVAHYNNGVLDGTNQAVKMSLDSVGNIYITGMSQNANGNLDYATIKYAPNGTQIWAARYIATNTNSAIPAGMVLDPSNNVIITGSAVTVKYDTNGNQLWTAPYAGASLASDGAGSIYVTGFGTNFNTEKIAASGSNVWQATYTDVGPTLSQVVMVDSQTNVYVAGSDVYEYYGEMPGYPVGYYAQVAVLKYDVNGHKLWETNSDGGFGEQCQVAGAALDKANNIYVEANLDHILPYYTMIFSNNGVLAAVGRNPTFSSSSVAYAVALDSANNTFVTGQAHDVYDNNSTYGTYKMNANAVCIWTNAYPQTPATQTNGATAIAIDRANNVYVTGFSPGTNTSNNIVTIKYANNGNQIWVQSYSNPGGGDAAANAIAVDALGNVYVTGYETTAGGTEMVTIKYAPSPSGNKQTNGAFLLQTQGEPGEAFDIQATTNFTNWLDLGTINADTNGNLQFLDTNAPSFNRRFYITKPQ